MKQLFSIITLIAACAVVSHAQDKQGAGKAPAFTIGLTSGLSQPFGNFAKTDYGDSRSGFAGGGFNLGVNGAWFLKKNFGVDLLVSYHRYASKGLQQLADGFKEDFDIDSSTVTTHGHNSALNVLIGPYYRLPVTHGFSVDFRLLAGFSSAQFAGYQVDVEDQGSASFAQDEAKASSFAMQAGVGAGYMLSRHLGLMIGLDYFYSKPDFTVDNQNRNNNAGRLINTYHEAIAALNMNVILQYMLWRK